jgi:ribosomal protein S8
MTKFQVGDVVRCRRKFSCLYPITNINALCKIVEYFDDTRRYYYSLSISVPVIKTNIKIVVIMSKEGYCGTFDVCDAHFRKATEKDKKEFMLFAL